MDGLPRFVPGMPGSHRFSGQEVRPATGMVAVAGTDGGAASQDAVATVCDSSIEAMRHALTADFERADGYAREDTQLHPIAAGGFGVIDAKLLQGFRALSLQEMHGRPP